MCLLYNLKRGDAAGVRGENSGSAVVDIFLFGVPEKDLPGEKIDFLILVPWGVCAPCGVFGTAFEKSSLCGTGTTFFVV